MRVFSLLLASLLLAGTARAQSQTQPEIKVGFMALANVSAPEAHYYKATILPALRPSLGGIVEFQSGTWWGMGTGLLTGSEGFSFTYSNSFNWRAAAQGLHFQRHEVPIYFTADAARWGDRRLSFVVGATLSRIIFASEQDPQNQMSLASTASTRARHIASGQSTFTQGLVGLRLTNLIYANSMRGDLWLAISPSHLPAGGVYTDYEDGKQHIQEYLVPTFKLIRAGICIYPDISSFKLRSSSRHRKSGYYYGRCPKNRS